MAPVTMRAGRFIVASVRVSGGGGVHSWLEGERFEVKSFGTRTEAPGNCRDGLGEVVRTTDVDVGVVQVAEEASHRSFVESHFVARPMQFVVATLASRDEFSQLPAVDAVGGALCTDHHGHVHRRGKVLEQRAQRRHAHASADQHDAVGGQAVASERAVRTFHEDASAPT